MRARACIMCKEYVKIIPGNIENKRSLENFNLAHEEHTLLTIGMDEIDGGYEEVMAVKEGEG